MAFVGSCRAGSRLKEASSPSAAQPDDYDAVSQRIAPWYAPVDPSQKTFHSNAKVGDDARQHIECIDGVQGADGNFYFV